MDFLNMTSMRFKKLFYFLIPLGLLIAGIAVAINVTVPSATSVGGLPMGLSTGNYTAGSLQAGSNITINTSTPGQITISSSGGSGGGVASTSPFTSGYIPYATSTLALTNSNIFQLGSNIGIGTTSPAGTLDIVNSSASTDDYLRWNKNNYGALDILNTNTGSSASAQFITGQDAAFTFGTYGGSIWVGSGQDSHNLFSVASSQLFYGTGVGGLNLVSANTNGIISFATGGYATSNERMRIDKNGNVGIGTTSPAANLHVYGSTASPVIAIDGTATANPYLDFRQANVEKAYIQYNNAGSYLDINQGGSMVIKSGNIGIGTTTPNAKLDVMGDVRFEGTSTLVSASIGGGALLAGACATATSSVDSSYSTSTTAVIMTPQVYPGDGVFWHAYISAIGVLTEKVCEAVAGTPTASSYVLKLIK